MDMQALISSAEATGERLNRLEQVLDALLIEHESPECSPVNSSTKPSLTSTFITISPTEIVVGLLAWTSMCIGVASATQFQPLHTTLGTAACFVLFMVILFISTGRKVDRPPRTATSSLSTSSTSSLTTATASPSPLKVAHSNRNKTVVSQTDTNNSITLSATPATESIESAKTKTTNSDTVNVTSTVFSNVDEQLQVLNFDKAWVELNELETTNSENIKHTAEFLWRKCEIVQNQSHWLPPKSTEAISAYNKALNYGELAVKADAKNAKAAEVLASVVGICMEFTDDKKAKLDAMWRMIELCQVATKIDPTLHLPYHIMGRLEFGVSAIPSMVKWGASYLHSKGIPDTTYEQGTCISFCCWLL